MSQYKTYKYKCPWCYEESECYSPNPNFCGLCGKSLKKKPLFKVPADILIQAMKECLKENGLLKEVIKDMIKEDGIEVVFD